MKKQILIVCIFFCYSFSCFALKTDSLTLSINSAKNKTIQNELLLKQAKLNRETNDTFSLFTYRRIFSNHSSSIEKAKAQQGISYILEKQGKYLWAIKSIDTAIQYLSNNVEGDQLHHELLILKSKVFRRKANYQESMNMALESEKIADKLNNDTLKVMSLSAKAVCYVSLNSQSKAMEYHRKALAVAEKINHKAFIAKSLSNIGIIYRENDENDTALAYQKRALAAILETKDSSLIATSLDEMGTMLNRTGNNIEAEKYLLEVLGIRQRLKYYTELSYSYMYLGMNANDMNRPKEAKEWLLKATQNAIKIGNVKQIADCKKAMFQYFKDNKQWDSAYFAIRSFIGLRDSLSNIDILNQIDDINIQYETSKKDNIIKDQKIKNSWLVGGLLSSLLLFGLLYNRTKRKNLEHKLTVQQVIFEEKEKANIAIIEAEEVERKRIGRDLHDNIGAYSTALIANVVELRAKQSEPIIANKMNQNAEQILLSLRETIWVLNNKSQTVIDFCDQFKNYCFKLLQSFEEIKFEVNEQIEKNNILSATTAMSLQKILQESMQNIIKHAKAKQIYFTISSTENEILLLVKDDGIGFDTSSITKGFGLDNMQDRAIEISFDYTLTSEVNKGSIIRLYKQLQ